MACECGWKSDRDVNAALVILRKGFGLSSEQAAGMDWPELKPLEREAAARMLENNPSILVSFPCLKMKPAPLRVEAGYIKTGNERGCDDNNIMSNESLVYQRILSIFS